MRKKRRLWNLVCPQPSKVYISYSIIHAKDDCAGIYVLPQLGVFSAAGCGIAVSILQN